MDTKKILSFLKQVMANNNREWFHAHKALYDDARQEWTDGVAKALERIISFDAEIATIQLKDCLYRFNRDTRFSPDKSPYKRHLGAYICSKGRKALRGGYYIHLEPGNCLLATGSYWLPTNILTSCRNEIMANIDRWLEIVENPEFVRLFGRPGEGSWPEYSANESDENAPVTATERGFGLTMLKTCPAGFPRDYEHIRYLRMKDYCCWHQVDDSFFEGDKWFDKAVSIFKVAKPMMDFMNAVIDDYE